MKRMIVGALALTAVAVPLAAQQSAVSNKPAVFSIAPYVGYMNFGDYFETTNNVEFSNENGALYGAQAQLDLGRYVSLLGNFGYTSSKFTFRSEERRVGKEGRSGWWGEGEIKKCWQARCGGAVRDDWAGSGG